MASRLNLGYRIETRGLLSLNARTEMGTRWRKGLKKSTSVTAHASENFSSQVVLVLVNHSHGQKPVQ